MFTSSPRTPPTLDPNEDDDDPDVEGQGGQGHRRGCDATSFTDTYGMMVQLVLALVAFSALIVKRFTEPSYKRRPWLVWFFDTSKQAAGAGLIHVLNTLMAPWFRGDACTWYLISFLLDSTLGLLIIYVGVKITACLAYCRQWPRLKFGDYGRPPSCRTWWRQIWAFLLIILVEKLIVTLLLLAKFWSTIRHVILYPIRWYPKLEMTLVVLVIPFFVNTLIFWCVDNFTMDRGPARNADTHHQYE